MKVADIKPGVVYAFNTSPQYDSQTKAVMVVSTDFYTVSWRSSTQRVTPANTRRFSRDYYGATGLLGFKGYRGSELPTNLTNAEVAGICSGSITEVKRGKKTHRVEVINPRGIMNQTWSAWQRAYIERSAAYQKQREEADAAAEVARARKVKVYEELQDHGIISTFYVGNYERLGEAQRVTLEVEQVEQLLGMLTEARRNMAP